MTASSAARTLARMGQADIGRFVGVAFGVLWTIMAFAITSSAPSEGPFAVAKFVFPLFGVIFIIAALFGKRRSEHSEQAEAPQSTPPAAANPEPKKAVTDCPHCGAGLTKGTAVSPHGDVLCQHCSAWYNIHPQ